MQSTEQKTIAIYADGAVIDDMRQMAKLPEVTGFTTNPSLMKRAGVTNYLTFAKQVVGEFPEASLSFEVFSLGKHVYVKIPILNLNGQPNTELIHQLAHAGIKLNITAVTTSEQVRLALEALDEQTPAIISLFVGQVADTGADPTSFVNASVAMSHLHPNVDLLWASTREVDNIRQAQQAGIDIITVPPAILQKWLARREFTPEDVALDTVRGFDQDISTLGFSILDEVAEEAAVNE